MDFANPLGWAMLIGAMGQVLSGWAFDVWKKRLYADRPSAIAEHDGDEFPAERIAEESTQQKGGCNA